MDFVNSVVSRVKRAAIAVADAVFVGASAAVAAAKTAWTYRYKALAGAAVVAVIWATVATVVAGYTFAHLAH